MGKFGCTCGSTISLNSIPEMNQAYLITDIALDNVAGEEVSADRLPRRMVLECGKCGRLWIEPSPKQKGPYEPFLPFVPERGKLRFFDDYGKGYKEEPPEDPSVGGSEPDEFERQVYVGAGSFVLAPHERRVVKAGPMETAMRVDRAIVPNETSPKILLHSPALMSSVPIVAVFGIDGIPGGMRDVTRAVVSGRLERNPGETVDFDVENTGDEPAKLVFGVYGHAKVPSKPFSFPSKEEQKEKRGELIRKLQASLPYGKFGSGEEEAKGDRNAESKSRGKKRS
jgi:hypothetical protein